MEIFSTLDAIPLHSDRIARQVLFAHGGSSVFLLHLPAGQSLPPHAHPGSRVLVLVLQGEGRFQVDGEEVLLTPHQVLLTGGEEKLGITNVGSDPLRLYVVLLRALEEKVGKGKEDGE